MAALFDEAIFDPAIFDTLAPTQVPAKNYRRKKFGAPARHSSRRM